VVSFMLQLCNSTPTLKDILVLTLNGGQVGPTPVLDIVMKETQDPLTSYSQFKVTETT